MKNVKELIEGVIARQGKTKKEVAESAGMSAGSFNKMLINPTTETLMRIASALGVKPWELIYEGDIENHSSGETSIKCPKCGEKIKIKVE